MSGRDDDILDGAAGVASEREAELFFDRGVYRRQVCRFLPGGWSRNAIDAFVHRRLAGNLQPRRLRKHELNVLDAPTFVPHLRLKPGERLQPLLQTRRSLSRNSSLTVSTLA